MKILFLCLLLLTAGCVGHRSGSLVYREFDALARLEDHWRNGDITFTLLQTADTELTVELRNVSEEPITYGFPRSLFEGTFIFVQDGQKIPIEGYHQHYLHLIVTSNWFHTPYTLEPDSSLFYTVKFSDLAFPRPNGTPDLAKPIFVYAKTGPYLLEAQSNSIRLKAAETVNWNKRN